MSHSNKSLVFSTFLILSTLCLTKQAQAQQNNPPSKPLIKVSYEDQVFQMDDSVLKNVGNFNVGNQSLLVKNNPEISELLANSLALFNNSNTSNSKSRFQYDPALIYAWVNNLGTKINQDPVEPILEIENNFATKFVPPQDGKHLDAYASTYQILSALEQGFIQASLVVNTTQPHKNLSETNPFGISELIAQGKSDYKGSSKNRITNITVGANRFNGAIVMPGQEFSFNHTLGPIEASGGFKPEIVIKSTGLVPEVGGGICQVATTMFRAAVNGGFPITQRKNHSFAVNHYAPQGTDATIYPGIIDLKFINDSPNAILILTQFPDNHTLGFDIYGTKDGRVVQVDKPVQYDRKSDGSMKATWKRTVTLANGETRNDIFKSVYLPPSLFKKEEVIPPQASFPSLPTKIQTPTSTPAEPI